VGQVRPWWWDSYGEVRLLRHAALCGGGRSLGIRDEARATSCLFRSEGFCSKAPPPTVDHKGEAATIHNEEYRDNPRSNKRISVYKLANARLVLI